MFHSLPRRRRVFMLFALLIIGVVAFVLLRSPLVTRAAQVDPVTAAWNNARASGSYRFESDVTQITIPSAKITNVGRSSRVEQLRLEGKTNLLNDSLELKLWSQDGSVAQAQSAVQAKIEKGKTYILNPMGEWKENQELSLEGVAPEGDFLSYLRAIRNIQAHEPESRAGIHFTRYSFTIDGPTYALYMHSKMEEALRAKGELPPGASIEIPRYYSEMIGEGELWVSEDGLPLRQILSLQFPEQKDESVNAQIKISFSKFGEEVKGLRNADFGMRVADFVTRHSPLAMTLFTSIGLVLLVLRYHRLRKLQNAVAIAVIVSFVVGPLLSTITSVRFLDAQSAKAAAQEQQQEEAKAQANFQEAMAGEPFNPHLDPITAAEQSQQANSQPLVDTALSAAGISDLNAAQTATPLPSGATNWWKAEGNSSDLIGSKNGTLNGSAAYAAGMVGQAFSFNGSNGYVALPANFFPYPTSGTSNAPFTLELWFKTSASGVILGQQVDAPYVTTTTGGYVPAIYVDTAGKLRVQVFWAGSGAQIVSANAVNNGTFQHLAVVYGAGTQSAYLNGTLVGSRVHTQTAYATTYQYQLGTGYTKDWTAGNSGWFNFNGLIDEPTIYNRALSQAEVQAIVNAGADGKSQGTTAVDSDSDGLSDFVEESVGSSAVISDTDSDGLTDDLEVRGFNFASKQWYLNPNAADSNGDGQGDLLEWGMGSNGAPNATPQDTDSDGTPDLFDFDNDNDGVPDNKDMSPYRLMKAATGGAANFNEATPFGLTLNNLTANTPVMVDFQIRPKDANHLWFAYNVLDWPQDEEGQMRDIDGATFASLPGNSGLNGANGDLKLTPMLEIRINGATTNLPPQNVLNAYNVTVNNFNTSGTTKVLYVPLSIISDESTGQRVAFNGRMRYQAAGSWPSAHEVRLSWVVQGLVDLPCDPNDAQDVAQGCKSDGYIRNVQQVLNSYYDDFSLTGISVREDRGASQAIVYEDPTVDSDKKDDLPLWTLSDGINERFLGGVIDLNEIVRRFNRTTNSAVSATERWAIPNTLRVEKKDYPTFDEAVITTAMTETKRILDSQFTSSWLADVSFKPLLLFVSEQRFRAQGLDSITAPTGNSLTLDFSPGAQALEVQTVSNFKATPYCAPVGGSIPQWDACDVTSYWKELETRHLNAAALPSDSDPDLKLGRMFATEIYFLSLLNGASTVTKIGVRSVSGLYSLKSDTELEGEYRTYLSLALRIGVPAIANQIVLARIFNGETPAAKLLSGGWKALQRMGQGIPAANAEWAKFGKVWEKAIHSVVKNKFKTIGIAAVVTLAVGGLVTGLLVGLPENNLGRDILIKIASIGLTTVLSVVLPILDVVEAVNVVKAAGGLGAVSKVLGMSSEIVGSSRVASAIGAVLAIGITWGFFIYSMVSNNVSAFSAEFNKALAEVIASTIYIIMLTIVSATVIGTILVAILGIIDGILTAICELGVDALRTVPGLGGACFTLGNGAIKVMAYLIYNYDQMIDTDRKDLVVMGSPKLSLADPNKGFKQGNGISFSMPVTTTAVHKNPDPANGLIINGYLWLFSPDNLRSTTFKYSLSQAEQPLVVTRDQMKNEWQNVVVDHNYVATPLYRGQAAANPMPQVTGITPSAGLNQSIDFYFNTGYALPAYECWIAPIFYGPLPVPTPICYTRELAGSNSTKMDAMKFDIFPATLDEFMKLSVKPDSGQGLAWDETFPSLYDADGDGLLARNRGGIDPNDLTWDSDGDGLSDGFELERRQAGVNFSLAARDTDNDGLTDLQETRFDTNPAKADSDGDGLKDGDEVWHERYAPNPTGIWEGGWDVTINAATPFVIRVSSDPLSRDGDGDGISDFVERTQAQQAQAASRVDLDNKPYHPNVPNTTALTLQAEIDDLDRIVAANQRIAYSATAVASRPLNAGTVTLTSSPVLGSPVPPSPLALAFNPGTFNQSQQVIAQTNYTVVGNATSQVATLQAQAQAALVATGGVQIASHSMTLTVDNDKPVIQLTSLAANSYVRAPKTDFSYLVIGGTASDVTSRPDLVRVTANDGLGTRQATGTHSWSATVGFKHGFNTLNLFARDAVGNETNAPAIEIFGDGDAPTGNVLSTPTRTLTATRRISGEWVVRLSGVYNDPVITVGARTVNGSGVDTRSLRLQLEPSALNSEQSLGAGSWQTATFGSANQWSIDYLLPSSVSDLPPNAYYDITLCGSDKVGNASCLTPELWHVDAQAPRALLTATDISSGKLESLITNTLSIGGVITDPFTLSPNYANLTRVQQLELTFTPITAVLASAGRVLQLNFEEAKGATYFMDSSGQGNHAECPAPCLVTQQPGKTGNGVLHDGAGIKVGSHPSLNFSQGGFSVQAWVKPNSNSSVNQAMRILETTGNNGTFSLGVLDDGTPYWSITQSSPLGNSFGATSFRKFTGSRWYHIMATYDRQYVTLYLDGEYVGGAFVGTDTTDYTPTSITIAQRPSTFSASVLDQLEVFNRALSDAEVKALARTGNQTWYQATLQQNPANASGTTWSLPIPSGLEGMYQIDGRSRDLVGNVGPNHNLWRGIIDTAAPRVELKMGSQFLFYGGRYEVRYTCTATDWHLDDSKFNCPGNAIQAASRGFLTDSILQSQFPTLTIRNTMTNTWTVWQTSFTPQGTLSACDTSGRCSTTSASFPTVMASGESQSVVDESYTLNAAAVADLSSEQPNAMIINPTSDSFVASAGVVEVTVGAEAAKTLREVSVLLDGEVVATIPFARIDKVTETEQTVSIPMSAGEHTLEARASDWAGNVQATGTAKRFTVVTKAPTATLSKSKLTISDTWVAQSGIVIIQGTVDDTSENLAAVQVKVGDQGYVDALVKDGVWGVAYGVLDPENRNLPISVRAIDKAGNITKIGQEASTDFESGVVPETTITAQPGNGINATIGFTGTVGNEVATAFECKLDEGLFTACTTPVEYKNLSNGAHTFQVHALNGQGTQDPTPAEVKWTVQGTGQLVTIESAPAATGTSRSARFEFEVAGEDESEQAQCSLDGGAFQACTSPASYSNLADGVHTFQVRVEGNPASKVTWRIDNSAPVAASMVVTTAQNVKVPVTLKANDESALKYVIVSKPANGTLSGTGANLVYQPGTDFFGTDSFSFKADDGDATSNLATVTVNITPQAGQGGLQRDGFVVFGSEGVILRESVKVMSGDIAASLSSNGPWLGDGAEVSIGSGVVFADAKSKVLGDTLFVGQGTTLANANYNELRGPGSVSGNKVTPQALPLLNRFVAMPGIGVGKQNVDVASAGSANGSVTLAPGNYLSLNVAKGGEVMFSGGVYSFKEWNVGDNTKLTFAAASEIRISGRAIVGEHSYVGPAPSSAVSAKQIVIYVAGVNANTAVLGGLGAKAATFGPYATLAANVVAPNGTLLIRERSKAVGSFVGRWVSVGKFSELTLANRFNPSTVEGRVDGYVNLTLDDATGINSTAALSPNVNDELLTGEGTNEDNLDAVRKVFLPVISSGAGGSGTVDSESEDSKPVDSAPESNTPSEEEQAKKLFLPAVSR